MAAVDRLPDAARRGRGVEGEGIAGDAGDARHPPADRGPDRAGAQIGERLGRLGGFARCGLLSRRIGRGGVAR